MEVIVSNKIYIKEPTPAIINYCKSRLVVANPEYHKKERMGVWLGNTPRELVLYEKVADGLTLPFGCLWDVYALEPKATYSSQLASKTALNYQSAISLYSYQEEAVKRALGAKNGIVVMPCGAGKTQTALEIIARLGERTLWLTHTQDLLNQSMSRAKSVLGIEAKSYGTITGGKVNIGEGITFATVQTMAKIDLTEFKDVWDVIVVDECHKAIGSPTKCMQFYKVLSALAARHKFGVTATPHRSDGLETTMFALLGGIVSETPREAVADTTCPVEVRCIETNYMPNYDVVLAGDGTLNYASLVDDLTHNQERFDLVSDCICQLPQGYSVMVLANRVEYLERLTKAYCDTGRKGICLSKLGNSKAAKQTRKMILRDLDEGRVDAVFATYQLASEGIDCPNLRYVLFATPEKDARIVEQASGRVARKANNKHIGTVIDFVDDFGMYKGWSKKRQSVYKKLKYSIDISDIE